MGFSVEHWKELCLEMEAFENSFSSAFNNSLVTEFDTEKLNNLQMTRGRDAMFGEWLVKFSLIYRTLEDNEF